MHVVFYGDLLLDGAECRLVLGNQEGDTGLQPGPSSSRVTHFLEDGNAPCDARTPGSASAVAHRALAYARQGRPAAGHAAHLNRAVAHLRSGYGLSLEVGQIISVLSSLPLAICLPSGLNATALSPATRRARVSTSLPLTASHTCLPLPLTIRPSSVTI